MSNQERIRADWRLFRILVTMDIVEAAIIIASSYGGSLVRTLFLNVISSTNMDLLPATADLTKKPTRTSAVISKTRRVAGFNAYIKMNAQSSEIRPRSLLLINKSHYRMEKMLLAGKHIRGSTEQALVVSDSQISKT